MKTFHDQENDVASSFNHFPFQNPQNKQNNSDIQSCSDLIMCHTESENVLNFIKLISINY